MKTYLEHSKANLKYTKNKNRRQRMKSKLFILAPCSF